MFNSITGIISQKLPQCVYLNTFGIEWEVNIPDTSLEKLPKVGNKATVYVWLCHTQDIMRLYGFATPADRRLFFDLLKVEGIAAKGALRIMSSISSEQLAQSLENGDIARLEKVPGVGKKTAAKMLLQLKGKLTLQDSTTVIKTQSTWQDIIDSLCNMGYEKQQCMQAVLKVQNALEATKDFSQKTKAQKEKMIFSAALKELI